MDAARAERLALCDLLEEVGPEGPTVLDGWRTADLAAHLLARDSRPDAVPGMVVAAAHPWTERVESRVHRTVPYAEIVGRLRRGPPRLSVGGLGGWRGDLHEMFVHHEDVRRATRPFEVRSLDPALEDALAISVGRAGGLLARKLPVGLALEPSGRSAIVVRAGPDRVTVAGPIGECVLFVYGRKDAAQVKVRGPAAAITTVREASLGI